VIPGCYIEEMVSCEICWLWSSFAECEDFRVAAHQQIHRLTADRYRGAQQIIFLLSSFSVIQARYTSCLFYIYISFMVIIYFPNSTHVCNSFTYHHMLCSPIEGCLEISLNHLISPWKRCITVRKDGKHATDAHYTVSSWNHHLVSFGDLPLRQFLT
jgi:hypothetical protein